MRPLSDARLVELNTIFLLYKEITTDYLIFFFFFFILLVALVVRMMHCTVPASGSFGGEMSVLARQRARLRWQGMQGQEEEEVVMVMMKSSGQSFPADVRVNSTLAYQHFPAGVFPPAAKSDPELDNGWPDFTGSFLSPVVFSGEHGMSAAAESLASISRTTSQPPMVGYAAVPVVFPPEKVPPPARKRKAVEKAAMPTRTMPMEDYKDKMEKREAQEDQAELAPKQSDQSSMNNHHNSNKNIQAAKKEASVGASKDNSKASAVQQKPDYIHVRARQGQTTDSHSLAERVRREKISERMKNLQDLVPGCNKVPGKDGMLDEIINYVQSLQRQVETMPTEDYKDKKVKGEAQEDQAELSPKQSDQFSMNKHHNSSKNIKAAKKEASVDISKDNSKASEVQQKPDYIHVRARRGQATDSHSLAERVRREKISERMKYLQELVPGCNKVPSKAGMLDEIINYVQSLQKQVEFLSMKLATVNTRLNFNIDDFFAKEMFPASTDPFPQVSMLPDLTNEAFLHYNSTQPVVSCGGLNVATNPPEISVRRTSSAPVAAPDGFLDTCLNGGQASSSATWDIDLHTLYNAELHQGRQSPFASQQFQGNIQVNDMKMEM